MLDKQADLVRSKVPASGAGFRRANAPETS
jgi:hypothetical protein